MNTGHAAPLRPEPVSWKRRFMRFGWIGLASRPEAAAVGRNKVAVDQRTPMNTEPRSPSSWTREHSPDEEMRAARDPKPRSGLAIRFQLGRRLKAIYGSDQAPMPDAMGNLLMQIEACLQRRK